MSYARIGRPSFGALGWGPEGRGTPAPQGNPPVFGPPEPGAPEQQVDEWGNECPSGYQVRQVEQDGTWYRMCRFVDPSDPRCSYASDDDPASKFCDAMAPADPSIFDWMFTPNSMTDVTSPSSPTVSPSTTGGDAATVPFFPDWSTDSPSSTPSGTPSRWPVLLVGVAAVGLLVYLSRT